MTFKAVPIKHPSHNSPTFYAKQIIKNINTDYGKNVYF